jgi:hypothetical protein
MYDYQAGACKYFPLNDVRISRGMDISLSAAREKPSECLILLGFSFHPEIKLFGAVIAQAYVGQRDTKWLTPLTVSDGYQGEEDNRHNIRRYRQSHGCSAFYFAFGNASDHGRDPNLFNEVGTHSAHLNEDDVSYPRVLAPIKSAAWAPSPATNPSRFPLNSH